jgi:acyl-coenzyme A synthetase/AMP-(fatty) acid ligase/acyl carrier protein
MAEQEITIASMTPPMGHLLVEMVAAETRLAELRWVYFTGDRLAPRDVARLRRLAPNVTCIAEYGATETQRADAYFVVPQLLEEDQGKRAYPLGRGMPDVQLLVLNNTGGMAGPGELGEIHMRSPHLALGYLGDEELTQERFITNPFTGSQEDRLYKTGDLGRYLPDGTVEFCGRADRQVKIRGFRIEPAEIESALEQHREVRQAVVVARDDLPAGYGLVAYVVAKDKPGPPGSELRNFLKQTLPEHMLPSAHILLDALPLTPNGKVDRAALPVPGDLRPDVEAYVAPQTPVEARLAEIWATVLGVQRIGIHDDFFELGGHSLLATQVISRIRSAFGIDIPLRAMFETPTIAGLASLVDQNRSWPAGIEPPSAEMAEEREEIVL